MQLNCNNMSQQYWSRDFTVSCLDCRCFHHLKFTEKLTPPKGNLIIACKRIRNLMQRSDMYLQYGCTCTWSCINFVAAYIAECMHYIK